MTRGVDLRGIAYAKEMGVQLPAEVDQSGDLPPGFIVSVLRQICGRFFPLLGDAAVSSAGVRP
jgi:hypothetical protein